MSYLLEQYWGWMLVAGVLGLLVGWIVTRTERQANWIAGWLHAALWIFAFGVVLAVLKLLPGRTGLWLETALLLFVAYLIGCWLSAWIRTLLAADAATSTAGARPGTRAAEIDAAGVGSRPLIMEKPTGALDNLKLISGVGHKNEAVLHELGIYRFSQIAQWTEPQVHWIEHYFSFPGRVEREDWRGQARTLAQGIETEFAKRVRRGEVDTSED
ncbi:hypothetical protein HX870_21075 [Pseudomonas gingeri]|uniref:hypothetical protein n=1 Tax=Pseudomonas gingeri TaxID=117681 RepID=UPI0015A3D52C|nr:hypothetical protein [Pseudomonas gingeri]NWA28023.1 hypothetical protein [Pseudomonas gingeri]NWD70096.1 hypothetical protein [Pseudomonas gingeri]